MNQNEYDTFWFEKFNKSQIEYAVLLEVVRKAYAETKSKTLEAYFRNSK